MSIVSERPKNASSSLLRGTILNNNASARPELLIGTLTASAQESVKLPKFGSVSAGVVLHQN